MGAVMLAAGAGSLGCSTGGPDGNASTGSPGSAGGIKVTTRAAAADGTVKSSTETWSAEKLSAMVAQKEALGKAAASGGAATYDGTYWANNIGCAAADTWIFDANTVAASAGMICLKNGNDDFLPNYYEQEDFDSPLWSWRAHMVWTGNYNGFYDCWTRVTNGTFLQRNYFSAWSGQILDVCPTLSDGMGGSAITTWVRDTLNSCSPSSCNR
jgi:hypothetical protein